MLIQRTNGALQSTRHRVPRLASTDLSTRLLPRSTQDAPCLGLTLSDFTGRSTSGQVYPGISGRMRQLVWSGSVRWGSWLQGDEQTAYVFIQTLL